MKQMSQPQDASVLAQQERKRHEHLLAEDKATARALARPLHPTTQTVPALFEQQAARTPDAAAVSFAGEQLTYRELNERANRLAHQLRGLGVAPEICVGLLMERSLEMVVAILGVLKAGGCYLPLDPTYPPERLTFMLTDARASVLLTEETFAARPPESPACVVCLDGEREMIAGQCAENPAPAAVAGNLAYIIYTSGSTGQPKGVGISHDNVTRLFAATRAWFRFNERDVWTLFHSYTFDFSVWELWGALLHGGRLVVVPFTVSREPAALYELLCSERVTVLNQTPSAFRQLMRAEEGLLKDDARAPAELALRLVIFGGEALELQSLRPWFERHGDARPQLVNMYGITETTVHVTYRPIMWTDVQTNSASMIGVPIADLQVHVLDHDLRPVPVGTQGEIYVGGAGLARGYLHRADLTAARFQPDPFSHEPGARLYRTGDLARSHAGGDLEYLGRADDQVKLRGFRIELGEINAALAAHRAVRESLVLVREDTTGEKRLVAYLVCDEAARPTSSEVRAFLHTKLPEHMIPSSFVFLAALPLTAHGKVDRQLLPAPDQTRPELDNIFIAPRTRIEQTLAEVWAEALGIEQVGIDDNYFALGGDSIRSLQVRAKALEKGLQFSLQQLFQQPTIRALAAQLSLAEVDASPAAQQQPFALISAADRRRLPARVVDAYPLSQLQAGMIFHSQYSPDYIIYVSSLHLRLPFDLAKFAAALDQMARRHEMLRTSFALTGFSEPLQLVQQTTHLPVHVADLSQLSPAAQQQHIAAWLKTEMRRRFDWTQAPLVRLHVHLRGPDAIQFTLSEPFFDGWSVATFCTELFERYFALLNERPWPVDPLAALYRDFVMLEREALESEQCRSYWTALLADAPASRLARRATGARAADVPEVVRLEVPISREVSDGLKRLAQAVEVSLKSVLLAAHMKVLSLLTGQADVCTGLLINGRPEQADGEQLLGAFLNTVPLRMQLHNSTWAELARRALETESELLPFRRYPIQELQRRLGAEELFDTVFNYTHFHVADRLRQVDGLDVLDVTGSEQTYYALTVQFNVDSRSARVELALDYRTIELDAEQVSEIADCYSRVLTAMATEPNAFHEATCLLSDNERRRLLVELNDTDTPFLADECIHQLFEKQVARTPDALAVVFGTAELSYSELNRRANRLARLLRRLGTGPETLVGILLERSVEMLVGLLAVLKAGGAYLPLDPAYPDERLNFMLTDARAQVVLTQHQLLDRLSDTNAHMLCLDTDWPQIALEQDDDLPAQTTPDNPAYVIYTSGSTGRPKGVLIAHRGVTNMIAASIELFEVTSRSRVLQLASLSFDASVLEIFMTLLSGATLYLVSSDLVTSGAALGELLHAHGITIIAITPSLLDLIPVEEYPALRSIVVGGEAVSAETVARWARGRRLFNAYAPTEATVYATVMECAATERRAPSLGRPIANMQVYLLDTQLQPVPIGIPAELYIGGAGLAHGYLNRPELTAARFLPNPFSRSPGARLYRTGDLARYRQDGEIEFIGRTDSQVKVRGFRVELGEIEAVLGQHPQVREAVVIAREDAPRQKRLVAYMVAQNEPAPPTSELRAYLQQRLPAYMLPAAFVLLDALPRTATGKLDRAALPAPEQARPELKQVYVAPQTALEQVLTIIFAEVLEVEQVGIYDNFFELGGHSLLATQVVARTRAALQVEVALRQLFAQPTVAGLAQVLAAAGEAAQLERTAELLLKLVALSDEEAGKFPTETTGSEEKEQER